MSYDQKCYDLAEEFLRDKDPLVPIKKIERTAQEIQTVIEDADNEEFDENDLNEADDDNEASITPDSAMQIGDTVLHVMGVNPKVQKVVLTSGHPGRFTAERKEPYGLVQYFSFGQIFDNPVEADRAIIRNIDRAVEDHQKQIDDLLTNRAAVMERLES